MYILTREIKLFSVIKIYMELASDILKRSENIKTNNLSSLQNKFKNLHIELTENNKTLKNILDTIQKPEYITTVSLFIEIFFDKEQITEINKEMIDAILMSYCISLFSNEIFDSYKSRFEQKLILAANKLIITLQKFINNIEYNKNFYSEFYNNIDNYFSLYKVWRSQDSIQKLTQIFNEIQEQINIINLQTKKHISINISKTQQLIDQIFNYNPKYATRILLHNYDIFTNSRELEQYFWKKVRKCYYNYYDAMFLIIVAELRIRLIPLLLDPVSRKKIYYDIDTEDLIQKIRNSKLSNTIIANILNIFGNQIKGINKDFDFTNVSKQDLKDDSMLLLNIFESFYHKTT